MFEFVSHDVELLTIDCCVFRGGGVSFRDLRERERERERLMEEHVHFVMYAIAVIPIRSSSETEVPGLLPILVLCVWGLEFDFFGVCLFERNGIFCFGDDLREV